MTSASGNSAEAAAYEAGIQVWRQEMDERLRSDTGWLTLTGLYWLHEGENTLGSDPACDVFLPESAPQRVGVLEFHDQAVTLHVTTDVEVRVDNEPTQSAVLRDDHDPLGPSPVQIGSVSFNVIKRADQYGIRVRDRDNPARLAFTGRRWFSVDPAYQVTAAFVPHPQARELVITNSVGIDIAMSNPGYVEFRLEDQDVRLAAFSAGEGELWFVFRDASERTYRAGRFLYGSLRDDGTAILDFNKAYNPPCAFTPYATCPLPPKENILPLKIEAGEQAPEHPV
ncbi:MAG: DUF1684 domain-containing protein [Anaerolineae bacterium]